MNENFTNNALSNASESHTSDERLFSRYSPYNFIEVNDQSFALPSFQNPKESAEFFQAIMETLHDPHNTLEDLPESGIFDLKDTVMRVLAYDRRFHSHRGAEALVELGLLSQDDPNLPWVDAQFKEDETPLLKSSSE